MENTGGASVPTAYGSNGRHVKIFRYRATSRPGRTEHDRGVVPRIADLLDDGAGHTIHRPRPFRDASDGPGQRSRDRLRVLVVPGRRTDERMLAGQVQLREDVGSASGNPPRSMRTSSSNFCSVAAGSKGTGRTCAATTVRIRLMAASR